VRVSVQLFAGLRERAGARRLEVELAEPATVADLLAAMAATPVGELAPRSCIVAVNREYAGASDPIGPEDELALIPPVSGGASPVRHVRVTGEPLDLAALSAAVRDPRAGAVVLFEGVTREVEALEYEAYREMAETYITRIAAEEAARHDLLAVAVEHRTGRVGLGEPSVIVAASSGHRGEAFAGARAVIDRVKAEAPIWKQEEGEWIEGELPSPASGHRTES
jgi:molybdopterin synthase catalytic subunit